MGLSLFALAAAFTLCGDGPRTNCVVDGDTFWINGVKVRLADINAPETQQAGCPAERDLGNRAKDRLVKLLNAGPFTLEIEGRDTDRYGRALRVAKPLVKHRQNGVSYKPKPTTYALKKAKFIRDAQAALVESAQMLADAACVNREAEVEAYLAQGVNTHTFMLRVLNASSWADKWQAMMEATGVPLSKRLRFFLYAAFPWLYMPGMWLKSVLKK